MGRFKSENFRRLQKINLKKRKPAPIYVKSARAFFVSFSQYLCNADENVLKSFVAAQSHAVDLNLSAFVIDDSTVLGQVSSAYTDIII